MFLPNPSIWGVNFNALKLMRHHNLWISKGWPLLASRASILFKWTTFYFWINARTLSWKWFNKEWCNRLLGKVRRPFFENSRPKNLPNVINWTKQLHNSTIVVALIIHSFTRDRGLTIQLFSFTTWVSVPFSPSPTPFFSFPSLLFLIMPKNMYFTFRNSTEWIKLNWTLR